MAGIFDEVMEGINAKEGQTKPAVANNATAQTETKPAAPAASVDKSLHSYSDEFKDKYGEKK